jgi:hypothetical protein
MDRSLKGVWKMRSLMIACAVMLVAGTACAGVPDATLASFGLGGMQQMTDAQGLNVRGMGASISVNYSITSVATVGGRSGTTQTTTVLTGSAYADNGSSVGLVGGAAAGSLSAPPLRGSLAVAVGGFYAFTSVPSRH